MIGEVSLLLEMIFADHVAAATAPETAPNGRRRLAILLPEA